MAASREPIARCRRRQARRRARISERARRAAHEAHADAPDVLRAQVVLGRHEAHVEGLGEHALQAPRILVTEGRRNGRQAPPGSPGDGGGGPGPVEGGMIGAGMHELPAAATPRPASAAQPSRDNDVEGGAHGARRKDRAAEPAWGMAGLSGSGS